MYYSDKNEKHVNTKAVGINKFSAYHRRIKLIANFVVCSPLNGTIHSGMVIIIQGISSERAIDYK